MKMSLVTIFFLAWYFHICYGLLAIDCGHAGRRSTTLLDHKEQNYLRDSDLERASRRSATNQKLLKLPLLWYYVQPTYSCSDQKRVGFVLGDGGKYICDMYRVTNMGEKCLYYGLGVANNVVFDEEFRELAPSCEMHTFDPTPKVVAGPSPAKLRMLDIEFHPWGLAGREGQTKIILQEKSVPVFSLEEIMKKLGHTGRVITVLKVDVEGAEIGAFALALAHCDRNQPLFYQLQVEMHGPSKSILLKFADDLHRCGYRVFSVDTNYYCARCMEYGWVHEKFLHCHL